MTRSFYQSLLVALKLSYTATNAKGNAGNQFYEIRFQIRKSEEKRNVNKGVAKLKWRWARYIARQSIDYPRESKITIGSPQKILRDDC